MRKCLFLLLVFGAVCVKAGDFTYNYLVMADNEGQRTPLNVNGLELKFSDGMLMAVNADGTYTFQLASLASMYFSETTTSITEADKANSHSSFEVFTLSGLCRGSFADMSDIKGSLPAGIYVVRQNGKTTKIALK